MKALIAMLLAWICVQLSVEPPVHPRVERVDQQALVELAYGPDPPEGASVTALYAWKTKTVYLHDTWRRDSLRDRATLLHELVHHVQESVGLRYACLPAREADAYHLQAAWLKEQGVSNPYAFLDIDEFTIAVLSVCYESE